MAKVETITYLDDLTGDEVAEADIRERLFAWDGVLYQIDLGPDGVARADEALKALIDGARAVRNVNLSRLAVGGTAAVVAASSYRRPSVDREQNQAIRDWATRRGLTVGAKGRIAAEIVKAYHEEH